MNVRVALKCRPFKNLYVFIFSTAGLMLYASCKTSRIINFGYYILLVITSSFFFFFFFFFKSSLLMRSSWTELANLAQDASAICCFMNANYLQDSFPLESV